MRAALGAALGEQQGFVPAGRGCVQRHVSGRVCCFHFYTSSFLLVTARWLLTSPRCGSARVATKSFCHHFSAEPKERTGTETQHDAAALPASWRCCSSSGGITGLVVCFKLSHFFSLILISLIPLVENKIKAITALNWVCTLSEFSILQTLSSWQLCGIESATSVL